MNLYVIANWIQGEAVNGGLSGSDNIFIELCKRWSKKLLIKIFISEDGKEICYREKLKDVKYIIWTLKKYNKIGYFFCYFYRTIKSVIKSLFLNLGNEESIIYSSSDFWPDSFPSFILKLRYPKIIWIAGFYLFVPNPWSKNFPYRKKRWIIGFFYWITQLLSYLIIKSRADFIFITSDPDTKKFITKTRKKEKIITIQGGVNLKEYKEFLRNNIYHIKKFDGCFLGRFHDQKGVLELIDIWKKVTNYVANAKLAIIGGGPLESVLKKKINDLNMQNNIFLMGFRTEYKKLEIFAESKIIIHPAIYDSGGMSAAEAMALGLPGISFDLESLKTYYPKGMIKVRCFDFEEFAKNIVELLSNEKLYIKLQKEAFELMEEWDWDKRALKILECIIK